MTISAWVKPGASQINSYPAIISDISASRLGGSPNSGWAIYYNRAKNIVYFQLSNSGSGWSDLGPTLNPGTWYHLVGIYDGTNYRFYVNGKNMATYPMTPPIGYNGDAKFYIGGSYHNGSTSDGYVGTIDEVGLWNRALSKTEVSDLYNNGVGKTCPQDPPR